jgi:hypothetical protein
MPDQVGLVIGPTGATGGPIAAALARRSGWRVYGMSRTAPLHEAPFTHLVADLTDPASCRRALATIEPVTHAFFAARAPFREGGVEDVEGNVAMLAATLDALAARSDALEHVHLLEGIKWYGMHLGPYPTPSREDDPRHLPPNFYYDQQDLLSARAALARWSWSASRPSYICDFAPDRARNLITVLGTYAAICRELNVPWTFPEAPPVIPCCPNCRTRPVSPKRSCLSPRMIQERTRRSTSPTATVFAGARSGPSWRNGSGFPAACRVL